MTILEEVKQKYYIMTLKSHLSNNLPLTPEEQKDLDEYEESKKDAE